MPNDNIVN